MIKSITNNIRMWLIGKSFLNYMEKQDEGTIPEFLNRYDIKEDSLNVFKEKAPETLNEAQNTAVRRMYVFLRDVINGGGIGSEGAVKQSMFSRDTLLNLGLIDEDIEIEDRRNEILMKEKLVGIYERISWMNKGNVLKFTNYQPAEACLSFSLEGTRHLNGKAYLNENGKDISVYFNGILFLDTSENDGGKTA